MMTKKKTIAICAAAVAAALILIAVTFGSQGFLDMYRLYRQDVAREREIAEARAQIDSLKAEIELLKRDTTYIEKIARERLGMARKDEIIYKFVDEE